MKSYRKRTVDKLRCASYFNLAPGLYLKGLFIQPSSRHFVIDITKFKGLCETAFLNN